MMSSIEPRGAHILVVDDRDSTRYSTVRVLTAAGARVTESASAQDALKLAPGQALIVLDVNLPDMDGIEICRRIRKNSDVPIIMLTARDEDVDKIIGLEIGRAHV